MNLADFIDHAAPTAPPCFDSRSQWIEYLKAAAAAQNSAGEPQVVIVVKGKGVFNTSFPFCSDCASKHAYAMSKAAELALMRHIARRYGPKGIRANAIAPGLIWHYKFDDQWMPEGVLEQTRARQMIKSRFGNPDDVAALGALLLSDDGSFITAQTISCATLVLVL